MAAGRRARRKPNGSRVWFLRIFVASLGGHGSFLEVSCAVVAHSGLGANFSVGV